MPKKERPLQTVPRQATIGFLCQLTGPSSLFASLLPCSSQISSVGLSQAAPDCHLEQGPKKLLAARGTAAGPPAWMGGAACILQPTSPASFLLCAVCLLFCCLSAVVDCPLSERRIATQRRPFYRPLGAQAWQGRFPRNRQAAGHPELREAQTPAGLRQPANTVDSTPADASPGQTSLSPELCLRACVTQQTQQRKPLISINGTQ